MANNLPVFYWDTSCWVAVYTQEATTDSIYLDALEITLKDALEGRAHIVVCTLFYSEVIDMLLQDEILESMKTCPHLSLIETTAAVYRLAGELRERCKQVEQKLNTPDAVHVAAGQIARVKEIWTLDIKLVNKSKAGLLVEIPIVFPHIMQTVLNF